MTLLFAHRAAGPSALTVWPVFEFVTASMILLAVVSWATLKFNVFVSRFCVRVTRLAICVHCEVEGLQNMYSSAHAIR